MIPMMPLITQMVVDGVINRPQSAALPLRKSDVVLAGLAFFGLAAAGVCALLSFYFFMRGIELSPSLAALATAGVALVIALLSYAVLALLRHWRRSAIAAKPASVLPAGLDDVLDVISNELEDVIAQNPATATALAGLAGFVVAEKMH
jgi:hypothetical protein